MSLFKKEIPPNILSYAQSGEDRIIAFLLKWLNRSQIRYLDIGAHHPTHLSNTYLFYRLGHYGVCIEPDPLLFKVLKKERPKDIHLNIGVSGYTNGSLDFFHMDQPALNTFSSESAHNYCSYGSRKIMHTSKINVEPIQSILDKHFSSGLDLISLDVEGMDLDVLSGIKWDNSLSRPAVLCVETLSYTENNTESKQHDTIDFVLSNDYILYADTYINSIFVDRNVWNSRQ